MICSCSGASNPVDVTVQSESPALAAHGIIIAVNSNACSDAVFME